MKYVLVTGAGGGMGKSVVKRLSDNGYFVFALDKEKIDESANVLPLQVDLTNSEDIKKAFEKVKEKTDNLCEKEHRCG